MVNANGPTDVNCYDRSPLSSNISASKPEGEVAPVAVSRKRQLSVDPPNSLGDQGFANLEEPGDLSTLINEDPFLNPCPEGIHPMLWDVLKSIKSDTRKMNDQINYTSNQVQILEDQSDHVGRDIAIIKKDMASLVLANKTLAGRLIRAENTIEKQKAQIIDLRMRSMRDNIIIKTKGTEYQENRDEDTAVRFKTFLDKELHVARAAQIIIPRAHRMGKAGNGYNRMMIAKVPDHGDQKRIFSNASALRNTDYSISKQLPQEIEERRVFGWSLYKKARNEDRHARFEGGRLYIDREAVPKVDPIILPPSSSLLSGLAANPVPLGSSDSLDVLEHAFRAWAVPAVDLQGVREGLDVALNDGLATATNAPYAFLIKDSAGKIVENFHSDNASGSGLNLLKILREKKVVNIAVYVSSIEKNNTLINMKARGTAMEKVVSEALEVLGRKLSPK